MAAVRRPKKLASDALWEYALRLLGQRAHSIGELRTKLARRADAMPSVHAVLARLQEYGLADDGKFSEAFASSRLQNDGFGRFRVLRDLRARRVPASLAEQSVAKAFAGTNEEQLAGAFLERKYRGKDLVAFLGEEKNLASAYRRLRTGGFSSSTSLSVLKRYSRRAEDWEDVEPPETEEPG